jgi:hypothetical protein
MKRRGRVAGRCAVGFDASCPGFLESSDGVASEWRSGGAREPLLRSVGCNPSGHGCHGVMARSGQRVLEASGVATRRPCTAAVGRAGAAYSSVSGRRSQETFARRPSRISRIAALATANEAVAGAQRPDSSRGTRQLPAKASSSARHGSPTDAPESFDATHRVRSPPRFRRKSPPTCDHRVLCLRRRVFARRSAHPAVSGSRCRNSICDLNPRGARKTRDNDRSTFA